MPFIELLRQMGRRAAITNHGMKYAGVILSLICSTQFLLGQGVPVLTPAKEEPQLSNVVEGTWPPRNWKRVVAYRFRIPGEERLEPVKSGFTLLRDSQVNLDQLRTLSMKSVELTPKQTSKLLASTFSDQRDEPAACYDPHHLFLFYDESDNITNAIEICFGCTGIRTLPTLKEEQRYRHDFRALARLCDEIGIDLENRSAEEYSRILDDCDEE